MSDFKDEILKHYLDEDLQVTVDRDPTPKSTLNGLLYAGIFYTLLARLGEIDDADRKRFDDMVRAAEARLYQGGGQFRGIPGLYHRRKGIPNRQAFDDYVGIATASYFLGSAFAGDIVAYGDAHSWAFDNTESFAKHWCFHWSRHDRFPGLVAFYLMAARQDVPFTRKMGFSGALRNSVPTRRGNSTHVMLDWLKVQVAKESKLFTVAVDMWETGFKEVYGDTRALFAEHFGIGHPFASIAV